MLVSYNYATIFCLSISLQPSLFQLFLSRYIFLYFSTQMLIEYYTVPLSTHYSKFSHSLYPSAIHNITSPVLLLLLLLIYIYIYIYIYIHTYIYTYIKTQSDSSTSQSVLCACLPYSLCQVSFQEIHWMHNLIYQSTCSISTTNLAYFSPRLTQYPYLSSKHNL